MRLHRPIAAAALGLICALAQAVGVNHRPEMPTAEVPTTPIGQAVSHMDRSVGPRQDCCGHANGHWLKPLAIPAAASDIGGFALLGTTLDMQLQLLAVQPSGTQAAPGSPAQQVGDVCRAALSTALRDAAGLWPIQSDLDVALGAGSPADLGRLSMRLQASAVGSPLLNPASMTDMQDGGRVLPLVQLGTQPLSTDQHSDSAAQTIRDLYLADIAAMHQQLGDRPAVAAAEVRAILALDAELAAPRLSTAQQRDAALIDNLLPVDEAQAPIPAIDVHANSTVCGFAPLLNLDVFHLAFGTRPGDTMRRKPADRVRIW